MAETVNISQMAEQLSTKIFKEFFWEIDASTNTNWPCEKPEQHGVATHPTDVVFFYDEPYDRTRRYFQCDLKSYSKGSISKTAVATAAYSLANQVSCAEISETWQHRFLHQDRSAEISGLLFVYNHDKEFDRDFGEYVQSIDPSRLIIGKKSRVYIMGPDDINWLDRVCHSLRLLRGDEKIPSRDECSYYHPDLIRRANVQQQSARSATIEMLTSSWIVMKYKSFSIDALQGFIVFIKRNTSINYFKYLIDYLRNYQILENLSLKIGVYVNEDLGEATTKFQKAVTEYLGNEPDRSSSSLSSRLRAINVTRVSEVTSSFSEVAIGMQYER